MNDTKILPDDPKLTAYALGELDAGDHAVVEAALRRQPELRTAVAEIRATATQLEAALATEEAAAEPAPPAFAARFSGGEPRAEGGVLGRLLQFPRGYFVIGGLAAACFAVMFALRAPPATRRGDPLPAVVAYVAPEPVLERPGFVDDSLALLEPATREREVTMEFAHTLTVSPAPDLATLRPVFETTPAAELVTVPPRITLEGPGTFIAPTTPQVAWGNVVIPAGSLGSLVHTPSRLPLPGEIVLLPTFTVRASRLTPAGGQSSARAMVDPRPAPPPGARFGRAAEVLAPAADNEFVDAARQPASTLAVHVDTASYSHVRRILMQDQRPPRDVVRIEELLNYFPFRYAPPSARSEAPFAATLEVAEAPWAPGHQLVRIGLKGRDVTTAERPAANLVFLIDVSGSMNQPNKLPLVQQSMRLLVGRLRPDDRVAIVTYAGGSGLVLPSTPVARAPEILHALGALTTGGSTNGGMGLQLAYDIALANFAKHGLNRVILCTDGDFNVGVTGEAALLRLVGEKAADGVFLTALGFGMGDYKDAMLEQLAGHGGGQHAYIDTRREAEKVLVEQVSGTLLTIAKDVKVQVEFNPAKVASHRLIGYENRLLRKEDFANDQIESGEIGAGHTVTALYEITPAPGAAKARGDLLKVSVRYKKPDGFFSKKIDFPLADTRAPFAGASVDFRFAAAVAHFGMVLRDSPHRGTPTLADTAAWTANANAASEDPGGYRTEFLDLVRKAQALVE